jgi:hypothetical protein
MLKITEYFKEKNKLTKATKVSIFKRLLTFSIRINRPRFLLIAIVIAFTGSSILTAFSPLAKKADALSASEMTLDQKALSYATYNALRKCIRDEGAQQADNEGFVVVYWYINDANAKSGNWWRTEGSTYWGTTDGAAHNGSYLNDKTRTADRGGDGKTLCNDILAKGLSLWGYSSALDLLCDANVKRADGSPCREGSDRFGSIVDSESAIAQAIKNKVYGGSNPTLYDSKYGGDPGRYSLYRSAFETGCQAVPSQNSAEDRYIYQIQDVNPDGTRPDSQTRYVGGRDRSTGREVYTSDTLDDIRMTCEELATGINNSAMAYAKYRDAHPDEASGNTVSPECQRNPDAEGCKTTTGSSSCNVEGVGWIVCPILTFGAQLADGAYGFLSDNFLQINTGLLGTDPNAVTTVTGDDGKQTTVKTSNGTFVAWGIIRNLANIAFVIVFLIVIFSQLTGVGVSNYGVKKLLPRLIVGAILVNLSFYICQIAVDLSNIAGFGLKSILEGVANQVSSAGGGTALNAKDDSGNLLGIITVILTAGALVYFNLAAVGLAILAGVIILLTIFVILIARQALVVLLIVIAPLAFIAFLLPNTEKFFKQWRQMLTSLLLLFPIIGLLYGASLLASAILMQVSTGQPTDEGRTLMKIAAYLALVLPLIAVIPILRSSLKAIPAIGNAIQKYGTKAEGTAKNAAKRSASAYKSSGFGKFRANKRSERRSRIAAGTYIGAGGVLNPRNVQSQANARLNTSGTFNTITGGYGAQRDLTAQAQNRSDQKEALDMFGADDALVRAWAVSGGKTSHASYRSLNPAQQAQFNKMLEAGHDRRASSHLAVAQYLSENGKGNASEVSVALENARNAGANATVVGGAEQGAIAAYRKSGRGDAVAELQTRVNTREGKPPMTTDQAWGQVSASAVHRDAIEPGTQGHADYEKYLRLNTENTRKALVGYDNMEARAQERARDAIVAAAQLHQYNTTGTTPTISTIQDAKSYFNVK